MSLAPFNTQPEYYIKGIRDGNIAILSRAITLVESQKPEHQLLSHQVLDTLMPFTGKSFRLGITGVPGVGKSTFIEEFGQVIVSKGHKLAVLAVDPSSAKSKGSILGDKTRMEKLSASSNAFIRPSPSSGTLGGVTRSSYETVLLCEAAGFDFIIIETVGVGQSEVTVNKLCDFFLLLMLAGAGDELQGIKRGIMEMANAVLITKADGNNLQKAKSARAEYAHALHLLQAAESGWIPPVKICSSLEKIGIEEVFQMILEYQQHSLFNNYFSKKRNEQQLQLCIDFMEEQLKQSFYHTPEIQKGIEALKSKPDMHPFYEAQQLLNAFFKNHPILPK